MTHRILSLLLLLVILSGCGGANLGSPSSMGSGATGQPNSFSNTNSPLSAAQRPDKLDSAESRMQKEAIKAAPLVFQDEKTFAVPTYRVPPKLRERLRQERPELLAPQSQKFQVFNQHIRVSAKTSTMTFTGVLKIPGKQDEVLEMACSFDKSQAPWSCSDMVPTDPKIAAEQRLQATVNCLDVYKCKDLGLELFVVINGKTEHQLFQSQPFTLRRASSGDEEEEDDDDVVPEERHEHKQEHKKEKPAPDVVPPRKPVVQEKPTPSAGDKKPSDQAPQEPQQQPTTTEAAPTFGPSEDETDQAEIEEEEELSEEQAEALIDDPNAAIEIPAPIPMPNPTKGKNTIPGIEKIKPNLNNGVPVQAVGAHNGGYLKASVRLAKEGPGYVCRDQYNWGTNLMVDMLARVSALVNQQIPNKSPVVVANISAKSGGKLRRHASHRTGLDVDVVFPSEKPVKDMWSACSTQKVSRTVRFKGGHTRTKTGDRMSARGAKLTISLTRPAFGSSRDNSPVLKGVR
ncbi:MAG: hypothetical protein HC902_11320 [Calothrix sp. SM1_5_4]|nr:hypothetical protein [Calothrix sp. SM1_5_4]